MNAMLLGLAVAGLALAGCAGDQVTHDADQVAESYPAQAWPKTIVVRR